jgi:hypothetical protein
MGEVCGNGWVKSWMFIEGDGVMVIEGGKLFQWPYVCTSVKKCPQCAFSIIMMVL